MFISIWTDGSCIGNPGPGGWAAIVRTPAGEQELSGSDPATTNNRMELTAAIKALEALPVEEPCEVNLYSDSEYLVKGMTEWRLGWKRRGWRTADKKPVKNVSLWKRLDELAQQRPVKWHWVRGHDGHSENERADTLAREAIEAGATP